MCPSGMLFVDEMHNLKVYSVVILVLLKKICEKRILHYIDNWHLSLVWLLFKKKVGIFVDVAE